MPTVKILSWNIENFGKSTKPHGYLDFITTIINDSDAQIVGIMEVRVLATIRNGSQNLLDRLLNQLNSQGTGKNWVGTLSEPSWDGHHEQYFYLWDTSSGEIIAGQESFVLPGILSEQAFDSLNLLPSDEKKLMKLLEDHHYILKYFWINRDLVSLLDRGGSLDFGTDTSPLDDKQHKEVKEILIAHRMLGINHHKIRPPFIGAFSIGHNLLPIALFHAPNPNDFWKTSSINILGNAKMLRDHDDGLIMGDFNVTNNEYTLSEVFTIEGKPVRSRSGNVKYRPAFYNIEKQGYVEKLNKLTSLRKYLDFSASGNKKYLSEPYDRFFLKEKLNSSFTIGQEGAQVIDVIQLIKQATRYSELSNASFTILRQPILNKRNLLKNKLNRPKRKLNKTEISELKYKIKKQDKKLNNIRQSSSLSLEQAFNVYQQISDHMPIIISLDY